MRALWAAGTKAYAGERVRLPETTCYPRPAGPIPVIVGGSGRRTLRIAATVGDAANVSSVRPKLDQRIASLRRHSETVRITVLDLPTVGRDREDAWARVERLRGRMPAARYAERTNAGTVAEQRVRWGDLAVLGVDTVFLGIADLQGPDDVERIAGLLA
jgi:alkanesulfonate monooxygenase SsuD/methylene tetrahydromethanopterin reductase-like flavin-dependent oxidoreductase (luciferase family)